MRIGTVVKLKGGLLGNEAGAIGVAYERYDIGHVGFSFIFENGEYDGFDLSERERFLDVVGHCDAVSDYQFSNVIKLSRDFDSGYFTPVFKGGLESNK